MDKHVLGVEVRRIIGQLGWSVNGAGFAEEVIDRVSQEVTDYVMNYDEHSRKSIEQLNQEYKQKGLIEPEDFGVGEDR